MSPRGRDASGIGNTGLGTTDGNVDPPEVPPIDLDEIKQKQMLGEAVLSSFTADPNPFPPFTRTDLAWDISMPTTVIPGVNVEVLLSGIGDPEVVDPKGSRTVGSHRNHTYSLSLRAPKATRFLGSVEAVVDLNEATTGCRTIWPPHDFAAEVKGIVDKAFPAGGQIQLRGTGSSVDVGYDSFVVDVPFKIVIDNWFDAEGKISLGFDIAAVLVPPPPGVVDVRVTFNLGKTEINPGTLSSVLSLGAVQGLAAVAEKVSDGYLHGYVGPHVADEIRRGILAALAAAKGFAFPTYKLYDLTLSAADGLTFIVCPPHPPTTDPTDPTHPTDPTISDH